MQCIRGRWTVARYLATLLEVAHRARFQLVDPSGARVRQQPRDDLAHVAFRAAALCFSSARPGTLFPYTWSLGFTYPAGRLREPLHRRPCTPLDRVHWLQLIPLTP